jgi:hypothetical protein
VVDEPEQNESAPLITGVAGGDAMLVVTVAEAAEQPAAFVTHTTKLPAVVTEMLCVVAPFDQK